MELARIGNIERGARNNIINTAVVFNSGTFSLPPSHLQEIVFFFFIIICSNEGDRGQSILIEKSEQSFQIPRGAPNKLQYRITQAKMSRETLI